MAAPLQCGDTLILRALPGVPVIAPGDDLVEVAAAALERAEIAPADGDVLVFVSKVVSRAEGRFVDLSTVTPSPRAARVAERTSKDPRVVELVLRESVGISRAVPGALVVRHRLGFVSADAGIDASNAVPPEGTAGPGPWVLLLPENPDASAARLRAALEQRFGCRLAVVVSDSHGRPFRLGAMGTAIGVAGLPALWNRRGETDLFGRTLEHTESPVADQVAAAADLIAGQANEGRAIVHIRGLTFAPSRDTARTLCRPPDKDLYATPLTPEEEA